MVATILNSTSPSDYDGRTVPQLVAKVRNDDRFDVQKAEPKQRLRSLPKEGGNAESKIHSPLPSCGTNSSHD